MTRSEKIKKGLKEFFTRNLIVIILVRCGVTLTDQMINGVQGMIGDNIGVPAALLGVLTSVLMIVRIITRAPAGSVTDNGSKRNVIVFGCLVKAVSLICYAFAGNTIMFALARVLQGFSGAFLGVAVPAIFGKLWTAHRFKHLRRLWPEGSRLIGCRRYPVGSGPRHAPGFQKD